MNENLLYDKCYNNCIAIVTAPDVWVNSNTCTNLKIIEPAARRDEVFRKTCELLVYF